MRTSRLLGTFLLGVSLLGIAGCSTDAPRERDEAKLNVERAIGGPDYGSVELVLDPVEVPDVLGPREVLTCVGAEVTLTQRADARTLSRVLEALAPLGSCSHERTTISFAGRDTVISGDTLFFDLPPSDMTTIADAVYETWPREVRLDSELDSGGGNSARFLSRVPFAPVQLGSLAEAVGRVTVPSPAPPTDSQALVRMTVTSESDGGALTPASVVTFDPELSGTAAELAKGIAGLDAAQPDGRAPWGVELDLTADSVVGTVMLPVAPVYNPQNRPTVPPRWGALAGDLSDQPRGVKAHPQWNPVWSLPSAAALTAASEVHALLAQTGLRDGVEVVLVNPQDYGYVDVGHFDPAVPSAQHGLASAHPDHRD